MNAIYYDHARPDESQPGFRTGEAGQVTLGSDGEVSWDVQVRLSGNSVHALLHHGVVEALNDLGPELASIGSGRDALLPPPHLDAAARILYEADRLTYGARFDIAVGRANGSLEYRLAIDNREYQRSLSRLQFLVTSAGRHGCAVRVRI